MYLQLDTKRFGFVQKLFFPKDMVAFSMGGNMRFSGIFHWVSFFQTDPDPLDPVRRSNSESTSPAFTAGGVPGGYPISPPNMAFFSAPQMSQMSQCPQAMKDVEWR